jgi:hypothetical protein
MGELHATAAEQLERLFPNKLPLVPVATEEDPSSDVDDDFDSDDYDSAAWLAAREAEYERLYSAVVEAGAPARRSVGLVVGYRAPLPS